MHPGKGLAYHEREKPDAISKHGRRGHHARGDVRHPGNPDGAAGELVLLFRVRGNHVLFRLPISHNRESNAGIEAFSIHHRTVTVVER